MVRTGGKSASDTLPSEVIAGLTGVSPVLDQVTTIVTVDADGFPRMSLLSRSEIGVPDPGRLFLALWAGSTTTANIRRSALATLFRVDDGKPRSIRLRCSDPVPFRTSSGLELVAIEARVLDVQTDEVAYASIVSTLDFRLHDPTSVLSRWQEVADHLVALARS